MGWCEDDGKTFCSVGERDIDFLLLEELRCSSVFRDRFLRTAAAKMGIARLPSDGAVFHSVHRTGLSSGETDLQVEFSSESTKGNGTHAVLIEDKIDAEFSDRTKCGSKQTERYRAEIAANIASGRWVAAVVMLVAPQAYLDSVDATLFDATVSYESISGWFAEAIAAGSGELRRRLEHRRQIPQAAILRLRRGWERQPDQQVGSIWRLYHQIATRDYADLRMNYKGGEPPDSYTVSFDCLPRVDGLPKCRIDHVMERGNVDILVRGYAYKLPVAIVALDGAMGAGISLRRATQSLGVNIKVGPIRRFGDLNAQAPLIHEALKAVRRLKRWFEANYERLARL